MTKKDRAHSQESVKRAILAIVEAHPGITQIEIIEKMRGPRYKSMSGKTRNSIISRLEALVGDGKLQRHPPPNPDGDKGGHPAPRKIHYYSPNYPLDDAIMNDIKESITKLYKNVAKVEEEYRKYDFVILWDVYQILNGMGERLQKSIEETKQQHELYRRSDRQEIFDDILTIEKHIGKADIREAMGRKNCYQLSKIIRNIKKALHEIDDMRVKYVVEFQKSRSAKQREKSQRRLDKAMAEYEYEYSKLRKIEMVLNEKNQKDAEHIVRKYLQDDSLQSIYEMCGKYDQMLRTELEGAVGRISGDRSHAINRQLQLRRDLYDEKDADMQDKIEDEIEEEKSKEAAYDHMLDEICGLMKSDTRLKKILEYIKNAKTEGVI